jgi:GntR family transcriptional regulator, transcriptional repressor for pyruvate dehydrogenase complex
VPEVWDVRRTLEMRTAALAALNRTGEEAATIVALAEAMDASSDHLDGITSNDIALHEAIARASHNALFVQIVTSFAPMMEVAVPAAWKTRTAETQRRLILDQHLTLARAIADGDPAAAEAAMAAHFDASIGRQLELGEDTGRMMSAA